MMNETEIELVASFISVDEFYGKEIILPLHKLNKEYNLPYFKIIIRLSKPSVIEGLEIDKRKFDKVFVEDHVREIDNLERVLICGPPNLYKDVGEGLKDKIDPQKIDYIWFYLFI